MSRALEKACREVKSMRLNSPNEVHARSKEEFKQMFIECFSIEIRSDYDGSMDLALIDNDTQRVVMCSEIYSSDIKRLIED